MNINHLSLGQQVVILPTTYGHDRPEPTPAKVVKIGRVWVSFERIEKGRHPNDWTLRADTQNEGTGFNYQARFFTLDQWKQREAKRDADEFLDKHGIRVEPHSTWYPAEARIKLAAIIRHALDRDAE